MNMSWKQQIKVLNNSISNNLMTPNEKAFYKWISTQNRHGHLFFFSKNWGNKWFKIDQKKKR